MVASSECGLMNTGFVNYRLIRLAGKYFLNYQAAPVIYAVIAAAAFVIGRWKYRRLQVGKQKPLCCREKS